MCIEKPSHGVGEEKQLLAICQKPCFPPRTIIIVVCNFFKKNWYVCI